MPAPDYSRRALAAKLGIQPGMQLHVAGAPMAYGELLGAWPEGVKLAARVSDKTDLVHVFATRRSELVKALASYRARLKPTAVIWVSWPKQSSGVPSEITDHVVRELALPLGLVDIKVCAVDEVWSGLKLVLRKELR